MTRGPMVRAYSERPVDPADLDAVIGAAASSPTAGNAQGVAVVVVTDAETRCRIAVACDEDAWVARGKPPWLSSAPVHVVVTVDRDAYQRRYAASDKSDAALAVPWWWFDAGAAFGLVLAEAHVRGLAAGFLGGHRLDGLHSVLDIPAHIEITGLITIGHAAPEPAPPTRSMAWEGPRRLHQGRWTSS